MRRTKEDAQITKNQILEKAVQLFLEAGFSATTLEEIALKANVTRGAIYWHFEDKLDIVKALLDKEHQSLKQLLRELFAENIPPLAKIEKTIEEIVSHFFENKPFQNFIELTWFKIEYTQLSKLQTSKAELTGYFISNFEGVIKEAQTLGQITDDVIDTDVAITITNMINGMYRLYFILPEQISNKEEAMRSFTSYLSLIKT